MELRDLIFYVVLFGAWLLTFMVKKISTKTPSERKGIMLRILEFIAKLNSDDNEQANQQQAVMGQHISTAPNKRGGRITSKPVSPPQRKQAPQTREPISTREASIIHFPIIDGTTVKVRQRFSRKRMQQAIIWSEIIQPPVALRD